MPPFETPRPPFRISQLRTWSNNVEPRMRNLLWGDYWQRFNTIQIPILGEGDYFDNAIEVAKLAKGQKAEFERIFEERNKERRDKLLTLMVNATNQTIYKKNIFPCEHARHTVAEVCLTGSLLDFLRLLKGNAFGWEADAAEDVDDATSNLSDKKQSSAEKPQTPIDEEIQDPYDRIYGPLDFDGKMQADPYYYDKLGSEDNCGTQWPDDDYYDETLMERQIREEQSASATFYIGTYTCFRSTDPKSNDIADRAPWIREHPPLLLSDTSIPEKAEEPQKRERERAQNILGKHKRAQSHNDVANHREHKRQKLESLPTPSISDSSFPTQQVANEKVTRKRSRLDDASDYDRKRRKLQSSTAHTPEPCASSSAQKVQDGNAAKKRAKPNNDSDHKHKRRKLDNSTMRQAIDRSGPVDDGDNHGYRQNRKSSAPRPLVPSNARSIRRNGTSTFWELDHLGKPRLTS